MKQPALITGFTRMRGSLVCIAGRTAKGRCYLQINGVYTSPAYLSGRASPDLLSTPGGPSPEAAPHASGG